MKLPLHQEENLKFFKGFMVAVAGAMTWIAVWCWAATPPAETPVKADNITTDNRPRDYSDELPNPDFISRDNQPIYGPEDNDPLCKSHAIRTIRNQPTPVKP